MSRIAQRFEFGHQPLERPDLSEDPIEQLQKWWKDAQEKDIRPLDAVFLATVDANNHADGRIVLLKHFDQQGLVFFTNYESQKSRELLNNKSACLTIFWPAVERQVRIRGMVEKTTRDESSAYFKTRPRGAQLAAWASRQSTAIDSRAVLLEAYAHMEQRFSDQEVPCPEHWGGFRLKPNSFEFWQGRHHRLHDRFRYSPSKEGWSIERLAP
jgi:pyridoxamine 5'-phosphate oxidase